MSDELDPMKAESWREVRDVCGSCIAWRCEDPREGDELAIGQCKLRPEMGRVPGDLPKCNRYMPRGSFKYQADKMPSPKRRMAKTISVVRHGVDGTAQRRSVPREVAEEVIDTLSEHRPADYQPTPRAAGPKDIDLGDLKSLEVVRAALIELMRQEHGRSRRELHPKFKGGTVVAEHPQRSRAIPAERFFGMVDRLRSSLDLLDRALSERSETLGPELADLRAQVLRMQGSFTTFNLLFADRSDYFSGKD